MKHNSVKSKINKQNKPFGVEAVLPTTLVPCDGVEAVLEDTVSWFTFISKLIP
jgi:hypothetical protein